MPALDINLGDGDGAFAEFYAAHGEPIHLSDNARVKISGLSGGMGSGLPSVAIGMVLPDGRWVLFETSLRLFLTAADALKARFGDPRT